MRDAMASCDCPPARVQVQVRLGAAGCGRLRSGLPGVMTCTRLQALFFLPDANHAATLLFWAIAVIGPAVLLRGGRGAGGPATATPASTRNPAVATRNRTGRG